MLEQYGPMILRILSVLAGCSLGLLGGGMLYYVFFEDNIATSGNRNSYRSGSALKVLAVVFFLLSIWLLSLDFFPAFVVAFLSLFVCRLTWALAEGMQDAGRMYMALVSLREEDDRLRAFLRSVTKYRQLQDLRKVARQMYVHNSPQLRRLEDVIAEVLDDTFAHQQSEDDD